MAEFELPGRMRGGRTYVVGSESLTEIIREAIRSYLGEAFFAGGGSLEAQELEDNWVKIRVILPKKLPVETQTNVALHLDTALVGRGWYECREQGDEGVGLALWWVVRHKSGPLI